MITLKLVISEYARYLHANLDQPLESLTVDTDFSDDYRDHWLKNLPFEFQVNIVTVIFNIKFYPQTVHINRMLC